MRWIITIWFSLFCSLGVAQNDKAFVQQQIDAFSQELAIGGVKDWVVVKRYCEGRTEMIKMPDDSWCTSRGTYYVAYMLYDGDEQGVKLKKWDNCGEFEVREVALADHPGLKALLATSAGMESEEVLDYKTAVRNTIPEQRTAIYNCKRDYHFRAGGKEFDKRFSLFALSNDSGQPNMNYQHNNALGLVQLERQFDLLVKEYDSKLKRSKQ